MRKPELGVLYECQIESLQLILKDGRRFFFSDALKNGRASYVIFENLVRALFELQDGKGTGSDHKDASGKLYEQKGFEDRELYPSPKKDLFRCSSSSTFGANNLGPTVKKFLDDGNYAAALQLCCETGYDKNDFYVFTNTGGFDVSVPFRCIFYTSDFVKSNLDKNDPRMISRALVLDSATRVEKL